MRLLFKIFKNTKPTSCSSWLTPSSCPTWRRPLESEPGSHQSLAGEPAAASQIRQHQVRCGQPPVCRSTRHIRRRWIIEVRAVRDVEDVQEKFQRPLVSERSPPAGPNVDLEIVGTDCARSSPVVLHLFHAVR